MSHQYAIIVEVSEPLHGKQLEELATAVDDMIMSDLPNYLGHPAYEGEQTGTTMVLDGEWDTSKPWGPPDGHIAVHTEVGTRFARLRAENEPDDQ